MFSGDANQMRANNLDHIVLALWRIHTSSRWASGSSGSRLPWRSAARHCPRSVGNDAHAPAEGRPALVACLPHALHGKLGPKAQECPCGSAVWSWLGPRRRCSEDVTGLRLSEGLTGAGLSASVAPSSRGRQVVLAVSRRPLPCSMLVSPRAMKKKKQKLH